MKNYSFRSIQCLFIAIMIAMVTNACSTMSQRLSKQTPEEALRSRVEKLMNAKVNNDWAEVYDCLASSYRKEMAQKDFVQMKRDMRFIKYTIDSIEIQPSGDEAIVKLKYDVKMQSFDFNDRPETQHWIKEDGNWFEVIKKRKGFLP